MDALGVHKKSSLDCKECGAEFTNQGLLKHHMKVHKKVGDFPILLLLCQKFFVTFVATLMMKDVYKFILKHLVTIIFLSSESRSRK